MQWPANRIGLAQWLIAPEHPLTARVTVNRFWQRLFGIGLVKTSGELWDTRRAPKPPEAPRLASHRIHTSRLEHQGLSQIARHIRHLQTGLYGTLRT